MTAMPSNIGYGTLMANLHEGRHSRHSGSQTGKERKLRRALPTLRSRGGSHGEICIRSTDAGLAHHLVLIDPALRFAPTTVAIIGGSQGSGVIDLRSKISIGSIGVIPIRPSVVARCAWDYAPIDEQ